MSAHVPPPCMAGMLCIGAPGVSPAWPAPLALWQEVPRSSWASAALGGPRSNPEFPCPTLLLFPPWLRAGRQDRPSEGSENPWSACVSASPVPRLERSPSVGYGVKTSARARAWTPAPSPGVQPPRGRVPRAAAAAPCSRERSRERSACSRRKQKQLEELERERKREEKLRRREQKQRDRELRRSQKKLEKLQAQEQKQLQEKIRLEERKLLLAQRNLQSIRLIAELLSRAKVRGARGVGGGRGAGLWGSPGAAASAPGRRPLFLTRGWRHRPVPTAGCRYGVTMSVSTVGDAVSWCRGVGVPSCLDPGSRMFPSGRARRALNPCDVCARLWHGPESPRGAGADGPRFPADRGSSRLQRGSPGPCGSPRPAGALPGSGGRAGFPDRASQWPGAAGGCGLSLVIEGPFGTLGS